MPKKLISEQSVQEAAKRGDRTLVVPEGAIVTAAAHDRAAQLGVKFVKKAAAAPQAPPAGASPKPKDGEVVAIGSDHGGYPLKELLKPFLESLGYSVVDLGTYTEEACDYPDFAYAVARMVSLRQASKGIMIDSVGVASAMVANKVRGVRAACCTDEFTARSSREHNDANVLTLGGKVLGPELAKSVVAAWLSTNFGGGRHLRRVEKISEIEKRSQQTG
jgi:ribose 5-phosphate isomerase B